MKNTNHYLTMEGYTNLQFAKKKKKKHYLKSAVKCNKMRCTCTLTCKFQVLQLSCPFLPLSKTTMLCLGFPSLCCGLESKPIRILFIFFFSLLNHSPV